MRVLNLGCGHAKRDFPEAEGAAEIIGLDLSPHSQADVLHDLNLFPYPFESDSFDLIIMQDVIEHVKDVPAVLGEVYRLLRDGGVARIRTPHYSSYYAYNDPTHIHFFGAFVFPIMTTHWGSVGATLAVSALSLTGFLSAKFILPEVYGYVEQETAALERKAETA